MRRDNRSVSESRDAGYQNSGRMRDIPARPQLRSGKIARVLNHSKPRRMSTAGLLVSYTLFESKDKSWADINSQGISRRHGRATCGGATFWVLNFFVSLLRKLRRVWRTLPGMEVARQILESESKRRCLGVNAATRRSSNRRAIHFMLAHPEAGREMTIAWILSCTLYLWRALRDNRRIMDFVQ